MQDMSSPRFLVRLSQAMPTSKFHLNFLRCLRPPTRSATTNRPKRPSRIFQDRDIKCFSEQDVDRIRIMVIVTDEEWDIRNLRSSESLNKSISDEADLEEDVRRVSTVVQGSGRLDRQSRVLGMFDHL